MFEHNGVALKKQYSAMRQCGNHQRTSSLLRSISWQGVRGDRYVAPYGCVVRGYTVGIRCAPCKRGRHEIGIDAKSAGVRATTNPLLHAHHLTTPASRFLCWWEQKG